MQLNHQADTHLPKNRFLHTIIHSFSQRRSPAVVPLAVEQLLHHFQLTERLLFCSCTYAELEKLRMIKVQSRTAMFRSNNWPAQRTTRHRDAVVEFL